MRIVSGIQPTGSLHLGNYLGAIRNWVDMQNSPDYAEAKRFYFLADLHSITVRVPPEEMVDNLRVLTAGLLACGVDPKRSIIFNQARVPYHTELCWLLACTARIGWLKRMVQFKEKSGRNSEAASVGLFSYPILQAADVLLYQATHIPVGEDQKQHLELARDIATKFNEDFGKETGEDIFTIPAPVIQKSAARIMSLRDGSTKMSKSDPSDRSRINLTDDADMIHLKIKKAKSDSDPLPDNESNLAERPEARNLVGIYAAIAGESVDKILARFAGRGFGEFKPALAEVLIEHLRSVREEYLRLQADKAHLDGILRDGAEKAREAGYPTLQATYKALGLARGAEE